MGDERAADEHGAVFGFVRDCNDKLRLDIEERLVAPLHTRIAKRRDELQAFRDNDFLTVGKQVDSLAHDLARGKQPGWVAMRFDALEGALDTARSEASDAVAAARAGAKEYTDTEVGKLRAEVDVLRNALAAQVSTITYYRNTLIGAIVVFVFALLRDNLLGGPA